MPRPSFTPVESYLIDYLRRGRYSRGLGMAAAILLPSIGFSLYGMCRDDAIAVGIGWLGSLVYIACYWSAGRRTGAALGEILRKYEAAVAAAPPDGD